MLFLAFSVFILIKKAKKWEEKEIYAVINLYFKNEFSECILGTA